MLYLELPGRHVEKPDTLDLFPSSVREPKIEDLDLYTYVYIIISVYLCPVRAEIFNQTSRPKTGVWFKTRHLATLKLYHTGMGEWAVGNQGE